MKSLDDLMTCDGEPSVCCEDVNRDEQCDGISTAKPHVAAGRPT